MQNFKDFPKPLLVKIASTPIIGLVCLIVGTSYGLLVQDMIILTLSAIIMLVCVYKCYSYYKIAYTANYDVVEGTCVGITSKNIRKLYEVKLMNDLGIETTIRVSKHCKFVIGEKYSLYFKKETLLNVGSEYLSTRLATDNFLGYEPIKDIL